MLTDESLIKFQVKLKKFLDFYSIFDIVKLFSSTM